MNLKPFDGLLLIIENRVRVRLESVSKESKILARRLVQAWNVGVEAQNLSECCDSVDLRDLSPTTEALGSREGHTSCL
jgi:hypothetical protein